MPAAVRDAAFDPFAEVRRHQHDALAAHGKFGATAVFIGTMRDFNEGEAVRSLTLEHYPAMTARHLDRLIADAMRRFDIIDALVVHRVGHVEPADPIVVVAVWSAHRKAAFDACRHLMEDLKTSAPFWKKEELADRSRWVEHNTAG